MKQIVIFLLLGASLFSCNNSKDSASADRGRQDVKFFIQNYTKQTALDKDPAPDVALSIPLAQGEDSIVVNKINKVVLDKVNFIIGQEGKQVASYDEMLSNFINVYDTLVTQHPDYTVGWVARIDGIVSFSNSEIIDLKLESYVMTGGAHGLTQTTSLFFDPKTGDQLFIIDLVNDLNKFTELAEKQFRATFNIIDNKTINANGFMFEGDKFVLPENIFITNDGLVLHYNATEIAAYSEGAKEVLLPYDQLKGYLKIKLF